MVLSEASGNFMKYLTIFPNVCASTGMPSPKSSLTILILSSVAPRPAASNALSIRTACCSLAKTGLIEILLSELSSTIKVTFCPILIKAPCISLA